MPPSSSGSFFLFFLLKVVGRFDMTAKHGKAKDTRDPLHAARSKEVTTLYVLQVA